MPAFHYKAVDKLGHPAMGQMDAQNDADLEIRLEKMGLDLITFKPAKRATNLLNQKKVSRQDLVMFCFQLEQLSSAGVPILDALNDLKVTTENLYFQNIIGTISTEVEGGKLLSQALSEHSQVFDPVFISLIEAGEKTGKMTDIFNHLFHNIRWQDEMISKTKKLLAYPILILIVVSITIGFLMFNIVPQLVILIKSLGHQLPLQTRILISVSNFLQSYWWAVLSLIALVFLSLSFLIRNNESVRYQFDQFMLKMPFTGNILNKIILSRFTKYFALMYQAGIPILEAIRICENIVNNRVISNALHRAHSQINAGESMSESFKNVGLFPPMLIRMINIGENTGALDNALLNVSYFYDRDVDYSLEKLLTLISPALTIFLGLFIIVILISVFGPVYDSFSQLSL